MGRCAGPTQSQSSEHVFQPIDALIRTSPSSLGLRRLAECPGLACYYMGKGPASPTERLDGRPLGRSACLSLAEFQWSADLVIGDSTIGPHAGSGLLHAEGTPFFQVWWLTEAITVAHQSGKTLSLRKGESRLRLP